jgi:hypothetical protein
MKCRGWRKRRQAELGEYVGRPSLQGCSKRFYDEAAGSLNAEA